MTTFLDGPARAAMLMLRRAPRFLRVVESGGTWDALDQLGDRPRPEETLHAYAREGAASWVHIYRRRPGSGFYAKARYRLVDPQPGDAAMRDRESWRAWCRARLAAGEPRELKEQQA